MNLHLPCEVCGKLRKIERHHIGGNGLYFVYVAKTIKYADYLRGFKDAAKICARCHGYISKVNTVFRQIFWGHYKPGAHAYKLLAKLQEWIFEIFRVLEDRPKRPNEFVNLLLEVSLHA